MLDCVSRLHFYKYDITCLVILYLKYNRYIMHYIEECEIYEQQFHKQECDLFR